MNTDRVTVRWATVVKGIVAAAATNPSHAVDRRIRGVYGW
jgi:hypothetical protein